MATFFDSTEVEWGQFSLAINGINIIKVLANKYKVSTESEELYAAGDEPINIQKGNRKYSGEVKLLKGALDALNQGAVNAGYRDFTDLPAEAVSFVNTYRAKGNRVLQTDTQIGVSIDEFEKGFEQGAKKMEITLPYKFLRLKSA